MRINQLPRKEIERRRIEAADARCIRQMPNTITSRHDARNKGKADRRALQDKVNYGSGISEFVAGSHGNPTIWIRGKTMIRRKPGRFTKDTGSNLLSN